MSAKQVMKLVSKRWQEIKDHREQTEKYEYLSLRDRESYSILRKFWEQQRPNMSGINQEPKPMNLKSHDATEFGAQPIHD